MGAANLNRLAGKRCIIVTICHSDDRSSITQVGWLGTDTLYLNRSAERQIARGKRGIGSFLAERLALLSDNRTEEAPRSFTAVHHDDCILPWTALRGRTKQG
jgi:hypothetical protein